MTKNGAISGPILSHNMGIGAGGGRMVKRLFRGRPCGLITCVDDGSPAEVESPPSYPAGIVNHNGRSYAGIRSLSMLHFHGYR